MAMNLHWGRTLEHQWVVRVRPKHARVNYTIHFPYNASEYEARYGNTKFYYEGDRNRSTANHSALFADNQFQKKSRILGDMMGTQVTSHSFTTVLVIASIFLFVTLTVTAAVVVFCKKRNSVFAFQKSEQDDDGDYELDDICATDVEYTETECESECEAAGKSSPQRHHHQHHRHVHRSRSFLHHHLEPGGPHDSPARCPLVAPPEDDSPRHACRCRYGDDGGPYRDSGGRYGDGGGRYGDGRGGYQKMVVTAVMEKGDGDERGTDGGDESDDSGAEIRGRRPRNPRLRQLNKQYYGLTGLTPDSVDSDPETGAAGCPHDNAPVINITYADEPPNYESLNYIRNAAASAGYKVVVSMEKGGNRRCNHGDRRTSCNHGERRTCVEDVEKGCGEMYVSLPEKGEKGEKEKGQSGRYTQVSHSEQASPTDEHHQEGEAAGKSKQWYVELPPKRSLSLKEELAALTSPSSSASPSPYSASVPPTPLTDVHWHTTIRLGSISDVHEPCPHGDSPDAEEGGDAVCSILTNPYVERYGSALSLARPGHAYSLLSLSSQSQSQSQSRDFTLPSQDTSRDLSRDLSRDMSLSLSPGSFHGDSDDHEDHTDTTHLLGDEVCNRNYNNNNGHEEEEVAMVTDEQKIDTDNNSVVVEMLDNEASNDQSHDSCHSDKPD